MKMSSLSGRRNQTGTATLQETTDDTGIASGASHRSPRVSRRALLGGALAAPVVFRNGFAFAEEQLTLRLDFVPWGVHSATQLANAKGWFKQEGLSVDVQDGTGTLSTINMVAAGNIDIGLVQLGPMAIGRAQGLPVTSFAGFMRKGDLAVLVDAKTGPKTTKELAGKKIVCFANSPWAPFIDNYLKRIGFERGEGPNQVNVVMVSPAAMASTYASGGADGFMSLKEFGEPFVEETRPAHSFLAADVGIMFPSFGLIATDTMLAKRKDVLAKVAAIHARAWEYIFADPAHVEEAAAAIIAARPDKQLKPKILIDQTVLCKEFFATPNTTGKPMGWQSDADWKLAVASMAEAGVIKPDINIAEFYTNDLIKS